MRFLKYLTILPVAAFSLSAQGQATVTVSGTITPPGCTVSFSGSAGLNWNAIPWSSLSATAMTTLPSKAVTFQVQCPPGTLVTMAFWVVDPNKSSAQTGPDTRNSPNHSIAERIFGIGLDPGTGQKLGNFSMIGVSASFDGKPATSFGFTGSGSHDGTSFFSQPIGWAMNTAEDWTIWDSANNKPASASVFIFNFDVEPQLNFKNKLSVTDEVSFSGAAHFNVRYF
jgi:hypothetical protein